MHSPQSHEKVNDKANGRERPMDFSQDEQASLNKKSTHTHTHTVVFNLIANPVEQTYPDVVHVIGS